MTATPAVLEERLRQALAARHAHHTYRRRVALGPGEAGRVPSDGESLVNLAANDYLGLSSHPAVVEALIATARDYGVGAGASHLVSGHRRPHAELEAELADLCGQPRALLFSSGYIANQALLTLLCPRGGTIFGDRLNHASLIDAGVLARGRLVRYRHRDAGDLRRRLADHPGRAAVIVSDGVFSMDGDLAPLPDLIAVAAEAGAVLMLDDAHGFGVLGTEGRGTLEHFGIAAEQGPVIMGTLGKAFGVFGAFVAGSELLVESLIQQARGYIYTTALPPALAAAALAAVRISRQEPGRRDHLRALVRRLRQGAASRGLVFAPSETPIQPYIVGDAATALGLAECLRRRGFWVTAIRPPTVPEGTARLRVSLSAALELYKVDRFLDALAACHALVRG